MARPPFAFWFRYVLANRNLLESGRTADVLDMWKNDFPLYRGRMLEKLVLRLVTRLGRDGLFDFQFDLAGRFFDQKGTTEIDVILLDSKTRRAAAGECKANLNTANIPAVVTALRNKATRIRSCTPSRFYLFSGRPLAAKTKKLLARYPDVTALDLDSLLLPADREAKARAK